MKTLKIIAAAIVLAFPSVTKAQVSWNNNLSFNLNGVTLGANRGGSVTVASTNASYQTVSILGTTDNVVNIKGLTTNGWINVSNLTSPGVTNEVWCGGSVSNWPFAAGSQEAAQGRFIPDGTMVLHCACSNNTSITTGILWTPAN